MEYLYCLDISKLVLLHNIINITELSTLFLETLIASNRLFSCSKYHVSLSMVHKTIMHGIIFRQDFVLLPWLANKDIIISVSMHLKHLKQLIVLSIIAILFFLCDICDSPTYDRKRLVNVNIVPN